MSRRESSAGDTMVDLKGHNLQMTMKGTNARMDFLAFRLGTEALDRPVVDLTGLTGTYDFELSYTRTRPPSFPEGGRLNGEEPDTSGPNVFAALKQQLGLELRADKRLVDVIVIDHSEKITEN